MVSPLVGLFLDSQQYIEDLLWTKDKQSRLIPFRLNPVQQRIMHTKQAAEARGLKPRFIVLKARREGITTLEQADSFHKVATRPLQQVVTLAHDDKATELIFRIADLFYQKLPVEFKPRRLAEHNKRDLNFPGLRSLFYISTAGSRATGRGDTLNKFHGSEVAWWKGDVTTHRNLLAGLTQAASHGEGVLESTPNGIGNLFHELWQGARNGTNDWIPMFFTWWDDPTNRIGLNTEQSLDIMQHLSDEEKNLVARKKLDAGQIAWRREMQKELKHLFSQEHPEDDVTCFLVSGMSFFDKPLIAKILGRCMPPLKVEMNGDLRVWKEFVPGHRYAAGADVAEGLATGDYSTLSIIDVHTMEDVAALRGHWKPEEFARRSFLLCKDYGWPLLAGERNNHGHSYLNTLANVLEYPNLYFHLDYDAATGNRKPTLGWPTTAKTRPIMLDRTREATEKGELITNDDIFLKECLTFVKHGEKYEAEDNCHDDMLISKAIALQVREACLEQNAEFSEVASAATLAERTGGRIFRTAEGRLF